MARGSSKRMGWSRCTESVRKVKKRNSDGQSGSSLIIDNIGSCVTYTLKVRLHLILYFWEGGEGLYGSQFHVKFIPYFGWAA